MGLAARRCEFKLSTRLEPERCTQQNRSSGLLKLSIIIATHARPGAIQRLVDSLAPQFKPDRHELFIADNGTRSPTPIVAQIPLVHLHQAQPGKCRIQNRAIAAARGELLVSLDDDLIVSPNYLVEVERFFDSYRSYAAM